MSVAVLKIGDVSVGQGTKKLGRLKLAETPDGKPVETPFIAVNGSRRGKRLWVQAGVHGDEYSGMVVIQRLTTHVSPKAISGSLIMVPLVNPLSFNDDNRFTLADGVNMNGIFPGKLDGSITHIMAHNIFKELVSNADYLIDIHDGGVINRLPPVAIFYPGKSKVRAASMQLARFFGAEILWENPSPSMAISAASERGIPAICPEMEGEGRPKKEAVDYLYRGVINVMKHLGMIEGRPELPEKQIHAFGDYKVRAQAGGMLDVHAKVGQRLSKGDLISTVTNLYGKVVQRAVCPIDNAVTCCLRTYGTARTGEWLAQVSEIKTELSN